MARNRVIGKGKKLPWHLPEDLKYFKEVTRGQTVVMGKTTYDSIGKALPHRKNVIISYEEFDAPGCEVVLSIKEAMKYNDFFVIGGASIYKQFLPFADRLYLTFIDHDFDGDIFFPEFDEKDWRLVSKRKGIKDEKNPYDYYFIVYERK